MKNGYRHGDKHTVCTNEGEIVCNIVSVDIEKAMKEYDKYMKNRGYVYDLDPYKEGRFSRFCRIYFGYFEPEIWDYDTIPYYMPDVFICTNKNVAKKMAEFLKPLAYCDEYNQCGISINVNGKTVYVDSFDW